MRNIILLAHAQIRKFAAVEMPRVDTSDRPF
jgi:hypothetical protein